MGAVAGLCFEFHLNAGAASLILLVTLAYHALSTGFGEAAILAIFAVSIVDFFFTDPLYSFTVSDPADVITIFCFLLTSLIVTRIEAQIRLARRHSESLYEVSQSLIALPAGATLGAEFLERVCSAFFCEAVALYDARLGRLSAAGAPHPALDRDTRLAYASCPESPKNGRGSITLCLRARGEVIGAMGFVGLPTPAVAPSIAALAATGLDRAAAFDLARAEALNAEAEVLRSAILDALAHEFKVPLATIMTAAGGLSVTGRLSPDQAELAGLIESESERLSEVTTRLLRLAKLDRDQVKPQAEPTGLAGLVEAVARRQRMLWPDREIIIGSAGVPTDAVADQELIRLVLTQLLDNACRYATPGSPIEIQTGYDGDTAFVTVENSGPAISPSERQHIFTRFFRGEQARQSSTGSGLGLYVGRKIAAAHSGTLELLETHSDRVIFRLTLPRYAE